MANAFNSLYSHVSRTPVQKLATPEFSFSSSPIERFERFRSSVRSEPRSPVERLKDTVSKMCLYTGSPRGSDSTSPQPSPKKRPSLPDIVDVVLEKVKTRVTKKLGMEENKKTDPAVEMKTLCSVKTETGRSVEHVDELDSSSQNISASVSSSLSGETIVETDQLFQPELDTRSADQSKVAEVTRESLSTSKQKTSTFIPSGSSADHTDRSQLPPCVRAALPEDSHASGSLPVSSPGQCSITVSGWDRDDVLDPPDGESCKGGQSLEPNPATHQGLSPVTVNLQQANSFELEEVKVESFSSRQYHSSGPVLTVILYCLPGQLKRHYGAKFGPQARVCQLRFSLMVSFFFHNEQRRL